MSFAPHDELRNCASALKLHLFELNCCIKIFNEVQYFRMNESAIIISGVHLALTDAIKNVVNEKMSKLFEHEPSIMRIRVELAQDVCKKDQGEFMAKGCIEIQGPALVVAVYSENLYKAIDLLQDKLQRKIRRRSRLLKVKRKQNLVKQN